MSSRPNRHYWWGLFGGVCGAALVVIVTRLVTPAPPAVAPPSDNSAATPPVDDQALQLVQRCLSHIKNHRFEEFAQEAQRSHAAVGPDELKKFISRIRTDREVAMNNFGPSLGEFELLRVSTPSPSLVRFVYLERFARGGMWWVFILYRAEDRWQIAWVDWGGNLAVLFGGLH